MNSRGGLTSVHRSCLCKGITAMPILDVPHEPEQRRALFQKQSTKLKFELKLQDVLTRCSIAVSQNGLRSMSSEQEQSLDTLLNLFQAQVTSVGLDYVTGLYHPHVTLYTIY